MRNGERGTPGPARPPDTSDTLHSPVLSVRAVCPVRPGVGLHPAVPAQRTSRRRIVSELCAQAGLALDSGFDGVMTSEHHGGFAGYMAQPLQMASFILDEHATGWAAAAPLLLPLRSTALVAEEVAWLQARHRGRVGPRRGRGRPATGLRGGRRQPGRCRRALQGGAPAARGHAPRRGPGSSSRGTPPCWPAGELRSPCSARPCRWPPPFGRPGAAPASSWKGCRHRRGSPA